MEGDGDVVDGGRIVVLGAFVVDGKSASGCGGHGVVYGLKKGHACTVSTISGQKCYVSEGVTLPIVGYIDGTELKHDGDGTTWDFVAWSTTIINQKNADDTGHSWSRELNEHIAQTIHDRKQAKEEEKACFEKEYVDAFNSRLDAILRHGWQEYEAGKEKLEKYGAPFERALLSRIAEYRSNYFAWVNDFSLPTTNNLSERSLRSVKSKLKIAGQFESEEYAKYFAMIRTYIETCRRNNVNEIAALRRLCEGRPYTVGELFSKK